MDPSGDLVSNFFQKKSTWISPEKKVAVVKDMKKQTQAQRILVDQPPPETGATSTKGYQILSSQRKHESKARET
jgi:hypothetical protein